MYFHLVCIKDNEAQLLEKLHLILTLTMICIILDNYCTGLYIILVLFNAYHCDVAMNTIIIMIIISLY